MLEHKYSIANAKPEFLRGSDAALYALLAKGVAEGRFSVRVEPVNVRAYREYATRDGGLVCYFTCLLG